MQRSTARPGATVTAQPRRRSSRAAVNPERHEELADRLDPEPQIAKPSCRSTIRMTASSFPLSSSGGPLTRHSSCLPASCSPQAILRRPPLRSDPTRTLSPVGAIFGLTSVFACSRTRPATSNRQAVRSFRGGPHRGTTEATDSGHLSGRAEARSRRRAGPLRSLPQGNRGKR
jgi:hypothetical protein